jgi:polysaccharide deacetylase 2 family uncharacterized protein YibQ
VVLGVLLAVLLVTAATFGALMLRSGKSSKKEGVPSSAKAETGHSDTGQVNAHTQPESSQSAPAGAEQESWGYSWVKLKSNYPEVAEKRSNTGPPTVAIVIDDVGNSTGPLPLWTAIDAPLSFSVMPYPPVSQELALRLRQSGQQVMMHIPTQNAPPNSFSGQGQLSVGMSREAVFAQLDQDITTVSLASGINNHQGGLGCDDPALMTYEVEWAKQRGFYVVDSNSSLNSQVSPACIAQGLPQRKNQVFIDHQNEPDYIRGAMRQLADIARKNGTAIGICHWYRPNTAPVVGEMVGQLKNEGIHFAFARDVTN